MIQENFTVVSKMFAFLIKIIFYEIIIILDKVVLFPYHLANNNSILLYRAFINVLCYYYYTYNYSILISLIIIIIIIIIVSNHVNHSVLFRLVSPPNPTYSTLSHFVNCTLFCVCYLIIVIVTLIYIFVNLLFKILIRF